MQEFPKIENDKFVMVYCELNTGHVLDVNFNLCISNSQEAYQIFPSLASAVTNAKNTISGHKHIECNIYDHLNRWIMCLDKYNYETIS